MLGVASGWRKFILRLAMHREGDQRDEVPTSRQARSIGSIMQRGRGRPHQLGAASVPGGAAQ